MRCAVAPSASVYITSGPPSANSVMLYMYIYYAMACTCPEDQVRERPALHTYTPAAVGVLLATISFLLKELSVRSVLQGVDTTRAINKSFRWIIPFLFITVGLPAGVAQMIPAELCSTLFQSLCTWTATWELTASFLPCRHA